MIGAEKAKGDVGEITIGDGVAHKGVYYVQRPGIPVRKIAKPWVLPLPQFSNIPPLPRFSDVHPPDYLGPTEEANWVMLGRILVGAYPSSTDDDLNREILSSILELQMTTFVCLQQEYQHEGVTEYEWRNGLKLRPYIFDALALIDELDCWPEGKKPSGLQFVHFPIVDCATVGDQSVLQLCKDLVQRLVDGENLYIHCWGGHGRTGTVISIMLGLIYNLNPMDAMRWCQFCHDMRACPMGVPSPQTEEQRAQVTRILNGVMQRRQRAARIKSQKEKAAASARARREKLLIAERESAVAEKTALEAAHERLVKRTGSGASPDASPGGSTVSHVAEPDAAGGPALGAWPSPRDRRTSGGSRGGAPVPRTSSTTAHTAGSKGTKRFGAATGSRPKVPGSYGTSPTLGGTSRSGSVTARGPARSHGAHTVASGSMTARGRHTTTRTSNAGSTSSAATSSFRPRSTPHGLKPKPPASASGSSSKAAKGIYGTGAAAPSGLRGGVRGSRSPRAGRSVKARGSSTGGGAESRGPASSIGSAPSTAEPAGSLVASSQGGRSLKPPPVAGSTTSPASSAAPQKWYRAESNVPGRKSGSLVASSMGGRSLKPPDTKVPASSTQAGFVDARSPGGHGPAPLMVSKTPAPTRVTSRPSPPPRSAHSSQPARRRVPRTRVATMKKRAAAAART